MPDYPPHLQPCGPCSVAEHSDCESDSPEKPIGANPCPCWVIGHSTRFYGGEDRRLNHWTAGTPTTSPRSAAWQENVLAVAEAVARERTTLIRKVADAIPVGGSSDYLRATVELVLIEFAARMVSPRRPADAPPQTACPLCAHPMGDHREHGCDFAGELCDCEVHVFDFTPQDAK